MKKEDNKRLNEFLEKYEKSRTKYEELDKFTERQKQYDGSKELGTGKKATVVWNITEELIESQIDSSLPQPKVTPMRPTPKTIRNAQVIQDMIKNQLDRLPFETINDEDERTTKIMGGSIFLVEWDNSIKTHDTVGDISVRLINAKQFIPQQAVYETRYMDYLFLTFDDTKERIKSRYGKDVANESIDTTISDNDTTEDSVTQVICYYMNSKGGLGCFSWCGDTVLIDDDNFEARKDKVCSKCGMSKPHGENTCVCGSKEWEKRDKDYETITEDIRLADRIIPAMSPVRDGDEYAMEDYQVPMIDPYTQYPVMDYQFDERGMVAGEQPRMETRQRVSMEPTKIPYYYPKKYPVIIRKNVSTTNNVLGKSDCDSIADFQKTINKLLSKVNVKVLKAGSYLTKPTSLKFDLSDEDVKPINIEGPEQISMIKALNITFDVSQDLATVDKNYMMAKSVLGITDSYQGKADPTATSGRAKEAQIAQAAGRQTSKRVMKQAAYADMYEVMFKFMLAYSDEPRTYSSKDENGEQIQRIFDRYDFLEQDEYGNWYYDDQYLFSVDETGVDANDKRFMLEDLRTDLGLGAYGPTDDPETMLSYWKEKEIFGYPNASRNVKRWETKIAKLAQMPPQMPITNQNETITGGGMPNEMQTVQY